MNKTEYKPLSIEIARLSHMGTSFLPEKRGEKEIQTHKETFENLQVSLGEFFEQKHADKLHDLHTDYLLSHGAVMSSMIAGPANFPVERNRIKSDRAMVKMNAITEYCDNLQKWKEKADRKQSVIDGGGELAIAKAKLEGAKSWHETMKSANKIIRAAMKTEAGITGETREALRGLGIDSKESEEITIPNCFGGYGFESFSLTNSNSRIKSTAARVADLERQELAKESGVISDIFEIAGGKVIYDYAENRINVKHNEKPSREVIDVVKAHGFRWSRNFGTWTRKMTPNAKYSARSLIKHLAKQGEK